MGRQEGYGNPGHHSGYGDYGQEDYSGSRGGSRGEERRSQDSSSNHQQGQSFRGRGPKGYTRSDERLQEIICEKLTDDPDIDASDITVTVREQVVILEGSVADRWTKYLVEELVERCGGVKDVRNQLRTLRPGQQESSQQSSNQSSLGSTPSSGEGEGGGGPSSRRKSTTKPF